MPRSQIDRLSALDESRGGVPGGFPWRGMALGAVMALVVVVTSIFYNTRLARQGISNDALAACAVFYLILICGVLNPLLKLTVPRLAFQSADLFVAFSMMLVASAIPSWGLLQMWVSTVTAWRYFAAPENGWAELFIPYISKAAVVKDVDAVRWLYEGLPPGEAIPWQSWAGPVAFWFPFFAVLYLTTISLMVMFRKQWVEYERLAFPMMQFGEEVCRTGNASGAGPPFFKDRLVWLGAAIPFAIISYNGLGAFVPGLTTFTLSKRLYMLRGAVNLNFNINFPAIGFAYLVSLDIGLSLWLFHVVEKLETGIIYNLCGPVLSRSAVLYCSAPLTAHQGFGTMIVLFFWGCWIARKHLLRIFRAALTFEKTEEDAHEIMSYRAAAWCFMGGMLLLMNYLHRIGLGYIQAAAFMVVVVIVFYTISRVICEGGVGFARSVYVPNAFMVNQLGTNVLGPMGATALGFTFVWSGDLRTMVMTQAMQGMKLTESLPRRRPLIWCLMLAVVIALFGSLATVLHLGYKYGLYNCQRSWPVWPCGVRHWDQVANYIKNPRTPNPAGWMFIGVGGIAMWLLIFLRQRFAWWPVHYIGLPVCGSLPMSWLWFSVFLAWLVKLFIVKFATTELYNRSKMFFLGMIFGGLAAGGIWTIIGAIFQQEGSFLRGVTLG